MPRTLGITNIGAYSAAPSVGSSGDAYWNTTGKTLWVSDGSAWNQIGGGGAAAFPTVVDITGAGGNVDTYQSSGLWRCTHLQLGLPSWSNLMGQWPSTGQVGILCVYAYNAANVVQVWYQITNTTNGSEVWGRSGGSGGWTTTWTPLFGRTYPPTDFNAVLQQGTYYVSGNATNGPGPAFAGELLVITDAGYAATPQRAVQMWVSTATSPAQVWFRSYQSGTWYSWATFAQLTSNNPVTQAVGDSAAVGSGTAAARDDHKHGMPGWYPSVVTETSYGQSSSVGVASALARGDHTHGTPANPLPTAGTAGQVLSKIDATNYNVQWSSLTGMNYRGAWVAATAYALNDVVTYQNKLYVCSTAVVSSSSYVGANGVSVSSPGNANIPIPAGSQVGDLCVLAIACYPGQGAMPTGFTQLTQQDTGAAYSGLAVGSKVLASGDITNGYVSNGGGGGIYPWSATTHTFRGPTALDTVYSFNKGSLVTPSITPTGAGFLFEVLCLYVTSTSTSATQANLLGYRAQNAAAAGANGQGHGAYSGFENYISGATTSRTFTEVSAGGSDSGLTLSVVALNPVGFQSANFTEIAAIHDSTGKLQAATPTAATDLVTKAYSDQVLAARSIVTTAASGAITATAGATHLLPLTGAATVTLPTAPANGTVCEFIRTDVTLNIATIQPGGADTLTGSSPFLLKAPNTVQFIYNAGTWLQESTTINGFSSVLSAVNTNTANTLMVRDVNGNSQVASTPVNATDAASKTYVDTLAPNHFINGGAAKTAGFTAAVGTMYNINLPNSAGAVVIQLPTAPAQGSCIAFNRQDNFPYASFANITPGAGDTIDGPNGPSATAFALSSGPAGAAGGVIVCYLGTTWWIIGKGYGNESGLMGPTSSNAYPPNIMSRDSNGRSQVSDPAVGVDIANKEYVDAAHLQPVRVATTGTSYTLASACPNTLDGVSLAANDRILVKDQATSAQNGVYTVTTLGTGANGVWSRAADFNSNVMAASAMVDVLSGTANGGTTWQNTFRSTDTLGTSVMPWTIVPAFGQTVVSIAANATATANAIHLCGVSAASIIITLPTAPPNNTICEFLRVDSSTTYNVTIQRGGSDSLFAGGTNYLLVGWGSAIRLIYSSSTTTWQLESTALPGLSNITGAVVGPTPNTAMIRDTNGNSQVTSAPFYLTDIASKGYVDGRPGATPNAIVTISTSGTTATANCIHLINVTGSGFVTLPTAPPNGTVCEFVRIDSAAASFQAVAGGSDTLNNGYTSVSIWPGYTVRLMYSTTRTMWMFESVGTPNQSFPPPIRPVTATANGFITQQDNGSLITIDCTSGNVAVQTVPVTFGNTYIFKRIDSSANTCTITPASGNIDGDASLSLVGLNASAEVIADGTNLKIRSTNGTSSAPSMPWIRMNTTFGTALTTSNQAIVMTGWLNAAGDRTGFSSNFSPAGVLNITQSGLYLLTARVGWQTTPDSGERMQLQFYRGDGAFAQNDLTAAAASRNLAQEVTWTTYISAGQTIQLMVGASWSTTAPTLSTVTGVNGIASELCHEWMITQLSRG